MEEKGWGKSNTKKYKIGWKKKKINYSFLA